MHEIKCPHCGQTFTIDEAGYADIARQVRDNEFDKQLRERLALADQEKNKAVELAETKAAGELRATAAAKEAQIQELKALLDAADVAKELEVTRALAAVQKERDALAADLLAEAERFGMDALIETHDEAEMARACKLGGDLVGINNRSLRTFEVDLDATERLSMLSPVKALLVAESGIFTPDDVQRVADAHAQAILVGESLMRQEDVEAATRALLSLS